MQIRILPYCWVPDMTVQCKGHQQLVRLAYQPPAISTFLSEQTSHQQRASSTFLSEQTSTSHQPPAKRTGCKLYRSGTGHVPVARESLQRAMFDACVSVTQN
jgi:hypothetical protein